MDALRMPIRMEGTGAPQKPMMIWTMLLVKASGATACPKIVPNRGLLSKVPKVSKVPSLQLKLRMNVSFYKAQYIYPHQQKYLSSSSSSMIHKVDF